ncbi:MAG TPA: flagellar export chaperone FlgN [Anaerovoracaceae bacterium]|nr:flagellar export chaperone FlgN [Anaerovoracaceae bacterium]
MSEITNRKSFDKTLDAFHEYLSQVLDLYQKIVTMLQEEFEYILKDDLQALDESMKSQQALLFKTRNFDKMILQYQSELDISGNTLAEMINQFPTEKRQLFQTISGQFQITIDEINFYKEKSRSLLQTKLYQIDKELSKKSANKDNTTYNQNAAEVRSSLFSKAFEAKI